MAWFSAHNEKGETVATDKSCAGLMHRGYLPSLIRTRFDDGEGDAWGTDRTSEKEKSDFQEQRLTGRA